METMSTDEAPLVTAVRLSGPQRLDVENPAAFGTIVGWCRPARIDDLDRCIEAAADAQHAWALLPGADRWQLLAAAADNVPPTAPLERTLVGETGKVRAEARAELEMCLPLVRSYRRLAAEWDGGAPVEGSRGRSSHVYHDPHGVVGVIAPWNAPVTLSLAKVVPALLAGNSVVLLVSPTAPLAVLHLIAQLSRRLPGGVLQALTGEGAALGQHLVAHRLVRMIAFTGSTATGRVIAAAAAPMLKNLCLELGGNDPAVILDDRSIDGPLIDGLAAGALTNAGQICVAVKRVYVPARLARQLREGLEAALDRVVVGDGMDPATTMGPVHTAAQRERLRTWLAGAAAEGARVTRHGTMNADPATGAYILPRLVSAVSPDAPIVSEEQFGPVLPLVEYSDLEEAIMMANASEFGLCSSVWTDDPVRGSTVARRISAGTTLVNAHTLSAVDGRAPFGGMRQSGIGREGGHESLAAFSEAHTITVRA